MVLADFKAETNVRILNLGNVSPIVKKRMNDLGLIEGVEISLYRVLPFKGPVIVDCQGQTISFRYNDAKCIEVEAV